MPTTTKQRKKLVRLISAISDMEESIRAADLIIRGAPEDMLQFLFVAMVVAYGRPFTENYGVGRIQCDYPQYPDFADSEMPARHSRLLDLRNKFLAHSSVEGTRVEIVPPGVVNPLDPTPRSDFDFNVGKRRFHDLRYVQWLKAAPKRSRLDCIATSASCFHNPLVMIPGST